MCSAVSCLEGIACTMRPTSLEGLCNIVAGNTDHTFMHQLEPCCKALDCFPPPGSTRRESFEQPPETEVGYRYQSQRGHGKRGGSFSSPAMWLSVATCDGAARLCCVLVDAPQWDEATVPHSDKPTMACRSLCWEYCSKTPDAGELWLSLCCPARWALFIALWMSRFQAFTISQPNHPMLHY